MNAAETMRRRRAAQKEQQAKEKASRERIALELGDTVPPEKDDDHERHADSTS